MISVSAISSEHKIAYGAEPLVTFVTVCYRDPHLIRLLLKGVEAANFNFPFEYLLVNNSPGDGTGDMVREKFPWAQVIDAPRNVGFGAGNNIALRRMRGQYAMLVNPDLVIFPGEMEKLLEFINDHPDVGFVGPGLKNPDGSWQDSCYRFPSPIYPLFRRTILGRTPWGRRADNHHLMRDIINREHPMEVDALMGSAILIRRKALDDIGLFDERFFMYLEEFDLCRRAWQNNWRVVYHPCAKFVHYHRRESLVRWPWQIFTHKLARTHLRSAVYYFWKYRSRKHPHLNQRPVI